MAKKIQKSVKLPEGVERYEVTVSTSSREAFEAVMHDLGKRLGRAVSSATLMDVLCSQKILEAAVKELEPKIEKYREIEKMRTQVGIFFKD